VKIAVAIASVLVLSSLTLVRIVACLTIEELFPIHPMQKKTKTKTKTKKKKKTQKNETEKSVSFFSFQPSSSCSKDFGYGEALKALLAVDENCESELLHRRGAVTSHTSFQPRNAA